MKVLHVYKTDEDTVIAADPADAAAALDEAVGGSACVAEDFTAVPDDEPIAVIQDPYLPEAEWVRVTKTAREWADSEGRGLLCSTEW